MQDEYKRLANRFRLNEPLTDAQLLRLRDLADQHDNYLLKRRVTVALARIVL